MNANDKIVTPIHRSIARTLRHLLEREGFTVDVRSWDGWFGATASLQNSQWFGQGDSEQGALRELLDTIGIFSKEELRSLLNQSR